MFRLRCIQYLFFGTITRQEVIKMTIKAIVFDLGGILMGVSYPKTYAAFAALGVTNVAELYTKAAEADFIDQFECGKISEEEFFNEMRNHLVGLRDGITDQELITAWNSMLLDFSEPILRLVVKFKQQGYKTFILSNIDPIHLVAIKNNCQAQGLTELYNSAFDHIYYSCEIGFDKPYVEAFHYVAQDITKNYLPIKPQELLFIDDSEQHIYGKNRAGKEGAIAAGWHGLFVDTNTPLSVSTFEKLIMDNL